jgi:catechol 2,3-dioxygenase-like lactoylglutathione lyase family enzyme
MFSYVTLGTDDIDRARAFYDAALGALGIPRVAGYDDARSSAWGADDPGPHLWVTRPFDGRPATPGNGTMPALLAATRAQIEAFHAAALANGGRCEGPPALRPQYGPTFFAAYVRDPDGNKLAAVCYTG